MGHAAAVRRRHARAAPHAWRDTLPMAGHAGSAAASPRDARARPLATLGGPLRRRAGAPVHVDRAGRVAQMHGAWVQAPRAALPPDGRHGCAPPARRARAGVPQLAHARCATPAFGVVTTAAPAAAAQQRSDGWMAVMAGRASHRSGCTAHARVAMEPAHAQCVAACWPCAMEPLVSAPGVVPRHAPETLAVTCATPAVSAIRPRT